MADDNKTCNSTDAAASFTVYASDGKMLTAKK